jgi:hypothetical protein
MNKNLLFFQVILFGICICAYGQDPVLLIDEDFQDWTATEGVVSDPATSCESFPHQPGPDVFEINLETGGKVTFTLSTYAVSPLCNSKHVNRGDALENGDGVTTGFVSLSKDIVAPIDTVGILIISKLSNVSSVEFAFSCTGDSRGLLLYKSTDDGATWGDPVGGDHWESNAQDGALYTEDINADNVMLKFTSGTKQTDGTSQNSRIHNIKVWGVPGSPELGIKDPAIANITAYYDVLRKGLVIRGDVSETAIFDLMGRLVKRSNTIGNQTIDLSNFSDGLYILKSMDKDGRVFVQKFIKK